MEMLESKFVSIENSVPECLDRLQINHIDFLSSAASPMATPPFLLELRQSLASLPEGEEVLARWSDEGWYYRGIIRHDCADGSYLVEDSIGDLEKIWRENIIADNDDANAVLQVRLYGNQTSNLQYLMYCKIVCTYFVQFVESEM